MNVFTYIKREKNMTTIRLEMDIHAPIERCFDLSRSVDLHSSSMVHTGERAVAGVTQGLLECGDSVTWEAVHFGIRQRLTSRITELERPYHFVDEMVQGAFKEIRHVHEFLPQENGTLMIDIFYFRSPLGILGKLADLLFLKRYMRHLLLQRNQHIKHVAETSNDV
jgi:ligand-binding SRPBCC domain-containing protein